MADTIQTIVNTTIDPLVGAVVQKELKFKAKLVSTIADFSFLAGKGVSSVAVPKLGSFTVVNRTEGVAGDATALSEAKDTITLDQRAYVAWLIDSASEVETTIDAQMEFAKRAASAHGRYVDGQILSVLDAVAGYSVNGGTPADVTENDIIDMLAQMKENDANVDQLKYVMSPDQEAAIFKIAGFVDADKYGRQAGMRESGIIGYLYGVPVMIHNGFSTAQQVYLYDTDAVGIAFQMNPNMSQQMANEYGSTAMRVALDQKFGVAGLQLGEKGVAAANSPLAIKLNGAL